MAQQLINVGSAPNDGTGDNLRDGCIKINDNFTELYAGVGSVPAVDNDTTMAGDSTSRPPSQHAVITYVAACIAGLIASAPGALDTLDELAAALGDDANFASTVTAALAGKAAKASNLSDLTNAATAWANILQAAGAPDFRTGTDATKALTSDAVWDAADYVTLNDSGGNIAVDLSAGLNFKMTMDGDYTLSAPSNGKPGQTGVIVLTQDGTGTQTLAYNAAWKFAGGTDPVLSTAASTIDLLFYQVLPNGTDVYGTLVKAIA